MDRAAPATVYRQAHLLPVWQQLQALPVVQVATVVEPRVVMQVAVAQDGNRMVSRTVRQATTGARAGPVIL